MEKVLLFILLFVFCLLPFCDSEERETGVPRKDEFKVEFKRCEVPEEVIEKAKEAIKKEGYKVSLYEVYLTGQFTNGDDIYWWIDFKTKRLLRTPNGELYFDGANRVAVWINKRTGEIKLGALPFE